MARILGSIPVTGVLAPTDTSDTYPVVDPLYGIDGLRSVADHAARNAIPNQRRRVGMLVFTQNDGQYWRLLPSPWIGSESDWTLLNVVGPQGPQGLTGPIGPQGPQGVTGAPPPTYVFTQSTALATWTINHSLGKYPSVMLFDDSLTEVFGEVIYTDANTVTINFSIAIAGTAYLN